MADENSGLLALQEAYANVYNEIVKPDKVFVATQYFRKRWVPLLGPALGWVITALRQHCYWNKGTGEMRDWCLVTQQELADEVGISVSTLKRLLQHEHAGKFIADVTHRYRYDASLQKQVRKPSMYRVRMDDPLVPEDGERLKELVAQRLSGLEVDPETGQTDILKLLDRLVTAGDGDLQLNLSSRSEGQAQEPDAPDLDEAVSDLAKRVSKVLAGQETRPGNAGGTEEISYPGAVFVPSGELPGFVLAEDQVLLSQDEEGYLVVPMAELVKQNLRACRGSILNYEPTDCFYSVQHALGEGGDDWLPEEQERIDRLRGLERKLGARYKRLGAPTLEEALQQYFSAQLAAEFLADRDLTERERIENWVAYTRRAKRLDNPAGFLRSRIESTEEPPPLPR
jgi:hypothetical protein